MLTNSIAFLDELLADWPPPAHWPPPIQKIWSSTRHPNNPQRFQLMCFFCGHGWNPLLAKEFILAHWPGKFDLSAIRSLAWLEQVHKDELIRQERGQPLLCWNRWYTESLWNGGHQFTLDGVGIGKVWDSIPD